MHKMSTNPQHPYTFTKRVTCNRARQKNCQKKSQCQMGLWLEIWVYYYISLSKIMNED